MSDTKKKSEQLKRPRRCSDDSSDGEEKSTVNKFADDGSFLEMFKKMQQQNNKNDSKNVIKDIGAANEPKTSVEAPKPIEAKRKPKVLKVGIINKKRNIDDAEDDAEQKGGSAWDHYMKEVRMYKAKFGDDEDKNRPLVK